MKNFKIFNRNEKFAYTYEEADTPWEYEAKWRGRFYKFASYFVLISNFWLFIFGLFYIFKNF